MVETARLTVDPISIEAIASEVASPSCGARALFVGTVRDENDGRKVVAIDYTAYVSMAEIVLARIVAELESAAPGLRVALRHRLGRIAVGETSIVIAAASPRRDAAFAAVRQALERIKSEAPVWKRELYADGDVAWREVEPLQPRPER